MATPCKLCGKLPPHRMTEIVFEWPENFLGRVCRDCNGALKRLLASVAPLSGDEARAAVIKIVEEGKTADAYAKYNQRRRQRSAAV